MTPRQEPVVEKVRINADEVKARLKSGELVTVLDVRNDKAWEASPVKIAGSIRIQPGDSHIGQSLPKGQLTVVY